MNKSSSALGQVGPSGDVKHRIDAAAWALFLIWVGVAILANVGWGWFLFGIGAVILAAQVALRVVGEKIDGLWSVCGAVFLAAGVWETLGLTWPLAPLLIILLGVGVLWRTFFSNPA